MPTPYVNDAQLSKSGRWRLRRTNEAAMVRKTGPKIKSLFGLSVSGQRHRIRNRANVGVILLGAGMPRCGTTCLARNCHDAGGRQNIKLQSSMSLGSDFVATPQGIPKVDGLPSSRNQLDASSWFRLDLLAVEPKPTRRVELVSARF